MNIDARSLTSRQDAGVSTPMTELIADYARWHHLQVDTGDIDPAYPVLRYIGEQFGPHTTAWLILRHAAYYHIGSALRSFDEYPGDYLPPELMRLPTGTERRGFRDVRQFAAHWNNLRGHVGQFGGPLNFLIPTSGGSAGWNELTERLLRVYGNGRWAAYKICEMAQKILRVPIVAPDAGHAHSTGPRKGLALFWDIPTGNRREDIAVLDQLTRRLMDILDESDVAQVETSLCDFHSLYRGRYYLGKDIDEQLSHLNSVTSNMSGIAFVARRQSFPASYLGEVHDRWNGVDKSRTTIYRVTGKMVTR